MTKQSPRLRLGRPVWLDHRRDPLPHFPPLRQRAAADVAIVGGGITGIVMAWRFAAAGLRVVLLEANRIAGGSTAASTALLMQEPDVDFCGLADRYGVQRTRQIWELSRFATTDFVGALRSLRIECDLVARDSVYYARSDADAATLRHEFDERRGAGIQSRWLDRAALRRAANIDRAAAIRMSGNAQVDPFKACFGFCAAARAAGAVIHERSPVTAIATSRRGVVVSAGRGTVSADRVIVATGYATPYFRPLAARFRMLQTYVVATRPLSARERRTIGPRRVMFWDSGRPYYYGRWTEDGRLLLGGGDRPRLSGARRERAVRDGARRIIDHFTGVFPGLADVGFEYAWEGLFATTADGLPYIGRHRRYPHHLFALGYGGNGMTFGFLAAGLLLDCYRGERSEDLELFAFGRRRRGLGTGD